MRLRTHLLRKRRHDIKPVWPENPTAPRFGRKSPRKQVSELEAVMIDVPTVPSVPYHHAVLMESTEIPVFTRNPAGEKKLQRLSESSKIFETLKGFMNILRVYTDASRPRQSRKSNLKSSGKDSFISKNLILDSSKAVS